MEGWKVGRLETPRLIPGGPHMLWLITTTAHGDHTRTRDHPVTTRPNPWAARWLFSQLRPDLAPHITHIRPAPHQPAD